jgi:Cof subfamily protein (haloacid dehalogenase superfamily)
MNFEAVIVDLDGTLLLSDSSLGDYTREIFEKLHEKDVKVFVATGRPLTGALMAVENLSIEAEMAIFNGTQIVNRESGAFIHQFFLPEKHVEDLLQRLKEDRHDHFVYQHEIKHLKALKHQEVCRDLARIFTNVTFAEENETFQHDICPRISCFGFPEELASLLAWMKELENIYLETFPLSAISHFSDSALDYIELQAACDGKRELLSFIEKKHGIKADRVLAFGDQSNDLKLLEAVGWGVAVANAFEPCRRIADEVIASNDEEAVARYLEKIFL